jgi:hypothetical protein
MKKINRKTQQPIYTNEFRERCNEVAENNLHIQADSFNAIDSKAQTYISIIAIYIAILLGIVAIGSEHLILNNFLCIKIVIIIGLISFLTNIGIFFLSIFSKPFKSGVSVEGLNNMKNLPTEEIDKEIFSNLYWSVSDNREILSNKAKWLRIAEIYLGINFICSILACIYFISLL